MARRGLISIVAVATLLVTLVTPMSTTSDAAVAAPTADSSATLSQRASLSGADFNPEMIISDELFYDGSAMSAAQIQSFLDGKIGTCLTTQCLNVAVLPVTSRPASYSVDTGGLVCAAIEGGNLRASELIYRVQVACGISAKVILVTLQKEQGLVTSRAPSAWALRAAMGMGCPDTAACDDAFAGLATQIMSGTRQLKVYKVGGFGRQPGVQYVQYHPNASCGGTTVNVRNYATAALYNYTPYQPNASALANMWLTGDSCSSYGNRNFWAYYRTWFGSIDGAQFMVSTGDEHYLLARDQSDSLWAYPVKSNGGWGLRTSLGAGWGGVTDLVGTGDLDMNGYRDIIARDTAGKVWFYPGGPSLEFPTRRELSVDWSGQRILHGGYVDAGTDPDILTVDPAGDLWLWRSDGNGGLRTGIKVASGFGSYSVIAGVGDLSGDGCGDVIGVTSAGALMMHAGDCDGGFRTPVQIASGVSGATNLYTAGDFNNDGRADAWVADAAGTIRLYRGTGNGQLASTNTVDAGWNVMRNVVGAGTRPAFPPVVTAVSSTDHMFAGYLIARDASDRLWAYPTNGAGSWREPRVSLGAGWGGVTDIIGVGDMDANGHRDLIARDTAGKSWFYPGDGRLDYPLRRQITANWAAEKALTYGGYFDGDRIPDMLSVGAEGKLWLWPGDGTGQFRSKVEVGTGFGNLVALDGVGDFDGDQCGDLVALSSARQLLLYSGDCAGGIRATAVIASGLAANVIDIYGMGDFTGDRVPDLWLKNTDGLMRLFRGTGGGAVASTSTTDAGWGSFRNVTGAGMRPWAPLPASTPMKPPADPPPTDPPPAAVRQAGVGDVDGDGKRDLLGVSADGRLRVYYGDGAGGIRGDAVIDATWGTAGALHFPMGDFTGDGRSDIGMITRSGDFMIAAGNGSGFVQPVRLATAWGDFNSIVSGVDWDGDGKIDVIGRTRNGDLWMYRGDGAGGWASLNGVRLATGWGGDRPIASGDFDGDGNDDLLALHGSGNLWLYRGNGAGGWQSLSGTLIGAGFNAYTDVFSPGEFNGSGGADLLARAADGRLYFIPAAGTGQIGARQQIDSGWQSFIAIF